MEEHTLFTVNEELNLNDCPLIRAVSEVNSKLKELNLFPDKKGVSACTVVKGRNGLVENVSVKLVEGENIKHLVIPARRIFPLAPESVKMTIRKGYENMVFPPGMLTTTWITASSMELTFWTKFGNSMKDTDNVRPTDEETSTWELTDFMIRGHLVPMKDPR